MDPFLNQTQADLLSSELNGVIKKYTVPSIIVSPPDSTVPNPIAPIFAFDFSHFDTATWQAELKAGLGTRWDGRNFDLSKITAEKYLLYDMIAGTNRVPEIQRLLGATYYDVWVLNRGMFNPGFKIDFTSSINPGGTGYKFVLIGLAGVDGRAGMEYANVNGISLDNYAWKANSNPHILVTDEVVVNVGLVASEWTGVQYDFITHYAVTPDRLSSTFTFYRGPTGTKAIKVGYATAKAKSGYQCPGTNLVSFGANFNHIRSVAEWYKLVKGEVRDGNKESDPYKVL